MKTLTRIVFLAILGCGIAMAHADNKVTAGPKGGRLLETESSRAEFFVEKDKTVSLTFYDANLKPVAVMDQSATLTAETKDGKKKIEFEKKGDALVSKSALPEGEGYNVVVQLKSTPEAKPKNFRIPLQLHTCNGCKHAEYACTCDE